MAKRGAAAAKEASEKADGAITGSINQDDHTTDPQGEQFKPEDNAAGDEKDRVDKVLGDLDEADKTPASDGGDDEEPGGDEQPYLNPSFEPPEIPEIKEAAAAYVKAKEKRVKATEKETRTNSWLAEVMLKHQDELPRRKDEKKGLTYITYPLGDGTEAAIVPDKIKAKVQNVPDPDGD